MKRGFSDKVHHSLYEAKTHLSKLIERASKGQEFVITKNGVPMAKIVPLPKVRKRKAGDLKGKVWYSDDIMKPLPEDIFAVFTEGPNEASS